MTSSNHQSPPKDPPPNTIASSIRSSTYKFRRDTAFSLQPPSFKRGQGEGGDAEVCNGPRAKWPTFPFLGKEGLCCSAEKHGQNFSSAGAVIEPDLWDPQSAGRNNTAVTFMDQRTMSTTVGTSLTDNSKDELPYPNPHLMP